MEGGMGLNGSDLAFEDEQSDELKLVFDLVSTSSTRKICYYHGSELNYFFYDRESNHFPALMHAEMLSK